MSTFRVGTPILRPRGSGRAAELAREPDAPFWAAACGWVPGTGHCRNRDCAEACLFASQRVAEARRIARWRRLRRVFAGPRLR
ncbi:MAG TPA: hypothetical protein VK432_06060 [Stellaceae bacterium]|nr:hypothetical protein [Stellaceae bacterium]